MSLPLLITVNVLADIALLAGLAYMMSHARRLTPHVSRLEAQGLQPTASQPLERRGREHAARAGRAQPARPRNAPRAGSRAAAAHELG